MTMTPAEKAYQDWVDEGDNRYGSVHRDAFIAGYEAATSLQPRSPSPASVDHQAPASPSESAASL